jgi:hypothetical protein
MNICEKINSFEQHVLDRQLRIAEILGQHFTRNEEGDPLAQSAFAILSIGLSYFEMIEQFATGKSSKDNTADFFRRGFERVFPHSIVITNDAASLYSSMRCGMYHTAMPKDRCGLTREQSKAIANDNGYITINPAMLIEALIEHFGQYCSDLRDGCHPNLERNFETMWDSFQPDVNRVASLTTTATPAPWDKRNSH